MSSTETRANSEDRGTVSAAIMTRRTIHDFTGEEVPIELLLRGIEHARWAPNHHRTEPWRFYVLSRATGDRIAELNARLASEKKGEKAAEVKLKRWRAMPGWLVLTCQRNTDTARQQEDYAACCCAVQNLMLYLWSEGVGVKWSTGGVTRDPGFFQLLKVDAAREFVVGLFWYGYPAAVPEQQRKPLSEIVFEVG